MFTSLPLSLTIFVKIISPLLGRNNLYHRLTTAVKNTAVINTTDMFTAAVNTKVRYLLSHILQYATHSAVVYTAVSYSLVVLTADTYTAVLETADIFNVVLIIGVYYMLSEIVSHTLQTTQPDTLSL